MTDLGFHFRIQTLLYSSLQQTNTTQPTYLRFQALERLKGASSSAYLLPSPRITNHPWETRKVQHIEREKERKEEEEKLILQAWGDSYPKSL